MSWRNLTKEQSQTSWSLVMQALQDVSFSGITCLLYLANTQSKWDVSWMLDCPEI